MNAKQEQGDLIWHYTTIEAAKKILEGETLRLTDATLLNDSAEGRAPLLLRKQILQEFDGRYLEKLKCELAKGSDKSISLDDVSSALYEIRNVFGAPLDFDVREIRLAVNWDVASRNLMRWVDSVGRSDVGVFTACFTRRFNSLDHWRGYGASEPCAVGFSRSGLKGAVEATFPKSMCGDVNYFDDGDDLSPIRHFLSLFLNEFEKRAPLELVGFGGFDDKSLALETHFLKPAEFFSESEYRLAVVPDDEQVFLTEHEHGKAYVEAPVGDSVRRLQVGPGVSAASTRDLYWFVRKWSQNRQGGVDVFVDPYTGTFRGG